MPESTPTPPAESPKGKGQRASLNRALTDELKNASAVAAAAAEKKYRAALDEAEYDHSLTGRVNDLEKKIRADVAQLKKARTQAGKLSSDEAKAHDLVLAALQPIQTAAKRQFHGDDERLRRAYFIGESLANRSLADLLLAADSVLANLVPAEGQTAPVDTLPGVKPEGRIRELRDAIAKARAKDGSGSATRVDAGTLLENITADVAVLAGLRRQIQLAADQAFPWRASKVGSIRRAFLLPRDRPLTD